MDVPKRPHLRPHPELRHRRNTRYGWVANPYPTRTCTLQDAPSFAWRANAFLSREGTESAEEKYETIYILAFSLSRPLMTSLVFSSE
jgi:hypothetical protein